ncbi:Hypothetical_protein [Hexamita inflata]|uniref:Hypothetical_protein n=1 Tax=Hexamita inflata TaxID=28002 RepID=A0AA86NAW5_9EUKA|nr:Hypothetical protein HINF_LOCUS3473 [Hexamita inflata]
MKQLRQVVKPKHIKVEKQMSSSKNIIIVYDIDHKQQQNQFSFQYSKISILFRGYQQSADTLVPRFIPSQRQLHRQLPRSTMLVQVPNQLRLSEEAIKSDNPRR